MTSGQQQMGPRNSNNSTSGTASTNTTTSINSSTPTSYQMLGNKNQPNYLIGSNTNQDVGRTGPNSSNQQQQQQQLKAANLDTIISNLSKQSTTNIRNNNSGAFESTNLDTGPNSSLNDFNSVAAVQQLFSGITINIFDSNQLKS